ncbi:response regulator transcription factor [Paenibacillus sp. UNC499MF]|uniref:response regulator transcription factor n=1 Tax=Paenibacillus sp. UNC499MF TaxID=1502751 RepID=UPI0008A092D0|nr:response regulator transcription factor [Paenibacillus sp. UNC499MF]SEG52417.1 DNA-binding response regulator, OmpR family, contains REC and winged-helix (wHTH) domain [Paenibacillus sp. UNC499MF]
MKEGGRILIVEDDVSIAELERDYLELDGFTVDMEHHGETGLKRALVERYDLILLDVMLPGTDGFAICERIRVERDIPILMVSAKKEDLDKIRGFSLGADDYIIKPFSPGELVARVKAHLSRYERLKGQQDQDKDEIRIRGLVINRASRRVYVNGKEIPFTTKEFDLLTHLAMNPNRVFSKDQLFDHLWGMDAIGDISTVTVHIRKLREKIEPNPSDPAYIETIWGAGYRFKP